MPTLADCPDLSWFQQMLSGRLSGPQTEPLLRHLEACSRCVELVQTLKSSDTLLDVLRKVPPPEDGPEADVIAHLIRHLSDRTPAAGGDAGTEPQPTPPTQDLYPFLAPPQEPGEIGRLGSYRVLQVLGAGGMGMVFEAEDVLLKRRVALKVMKPHLAAHDAARKRFLREAQAAAAIEHEHIVTIHQVGEDRGGPFLAMQLLRGETLDARLQREKTLPLAQVLRTGRDIALALAAAHTQGLVHRDIKPSNIFLAEARGPLSVLDKDAPARTTVKVLDFGLARAAEGEAPLTNPGSVVGTPQYMAPEQARGLAVDARCDVFGLGCVLYRMATGVVPFGGSDPMSALLALALDNPQPPHERQPNVPPELSKLILHMLAKKPEDRPATMHEVVVALETMLQAVQTAELSVVPPRNADTRGSGPIPAPAPASRPGTPKRRWPLVTAAAVLVVIGAGLLAQQVIIRITDKEGKVRDIELKPGERAEILTRPKTEPDSPPRAEVPSKPAPPAVRREPMATLRPNQTLSPTALTIRPAEIQGVLGWTLETRSYRALARTLAFHPDGRLLATGGDHVIRLWETATGRLVRALVGHPQSITALAWSPDGKVLASADPDSVKSVWLWSPESGQVLRALGGPDPVRVNVLAWSPDGRTLAAGSQVGAVRLFDRESGQLVETLQGHAQAVLALAWSPDGKTVASGSIDQRIRLWDAVNGHSQGILQGHTTPVYKLAFAPDGKTLASLGHEGATWLWAVDAGRLLQTLPQKEGYTQTVSWSPDGKLLITATTTNVVQFRTPQTGEVQRSCRLPGEFTQWSTLSADGRILAGGNEGGMTRLWECDSGHLLLTLQGHLGGVQTGWTPEGKPVVYGVAGNTLTWFGWETHQGVSTLSLPPGIPALLGWSPGGKSLALKIWDGPEGKLYLMDAVSGMVRAAVSGRTKHGFELAWSPDGKRLAVAGLEGTVQLRDGETGEVRFMVATHSAPVKDVAWSPDGKLLACSGDDATVRIVDAATGKPTHSLRGSNDWVYCMAWSPDGKALATGSKDGVARIWDRETGKLLKEFKKHPVRVSSVAWQPDGKTLISSSFRALRFWDVQTGELRRTVRLPADATLSPDGKLAFCPVASVVQVWQTDGNPLGTLTVLRNGQPLAISPDGHYRGGPRVERELVYVVQTDRGQETLTPEEFAKRYGWKNDPEWVRLPGEK